MIAINRKPNVSMNTKIQAETMAGLYTVDLNNLSRIATMLQARCVSDDKETKNFIADELSWLDKFERSLYLGVHNNEIVSTSLSMDVDLNDPVSPLDSDQCGIDLFGATFLGGSAPLSIKQTCYRAALTGVINNFRFYTRPGCSTIVLDYRHLLDCITLFYCYRDMSITVDQIESILDDCRPGIVNPCTSLDVLIKFCLGLNRSVENTLPSLVQYKSNSVRDGELYLAMSQLRISTDCYQLIKGSNKIETWQHHRLDFVPKMLYKKVLDYSAKEILTTITYTIANDILHTPALEGTKIMCADNNCVALSIPTAAINNNQLHQLGDVSLRLFNRTFEIPCRIYKYNTHSDILEEL